MELSKEFQAALKRVVTVPAELQEEYIDLERAAYTNGATAWGEQYQNHNWLAFEGCGRLNGEYAIPTCSNGAGQFVLSQWLIREGYDSVYLPINTFQGIKTVYPMSGIWADPTIQTDVVGRVIDIDSLNMVAGINKRVYVDTPIGGSIDSLEEYCNYLREFKCDIIIDAAHSSHLGLEECLKLPNVIALVYSCFATKVATVGEGGLIVTRNHDVWSFCSDYVMYGAKNSDHNVGFNLRSSQANSLKMLVALFDPDAEKVLVAPRLALINMYEEVCGLLGIEYVSVSDRTHNGYKFIITDPRIKSVGEFATSNVFWNKHHICVATYPAIEPHISEATELLAEILVEQLDAQC